MFGKSLNPKFFLFFYRENNIFLLGHFLSRGNIRRL